MLSFGDHFQIKVCKTVSFCFILFARRALRRRFRFRFRLPSFVFCFRTRTSLRFFTLLRLVHLRRLARRLQLLPDVSERIVTAQPASLSWNIPMKRLYAIFLPLTVAKLFSAFPTGDDPRLDDPGFVFRFPYERLRAHATVLLTRFQLRLSQLDQSKICILNVNKYIVYKMWI